MALGRLGLRPDPLRGYNFLISLLDSSGSLALASASAAISILDTPLGGFSECTGLEMTLDVEEYSEGGRNGHVLRFPSRVKWSNITLKKGLASSRELWSWHYGFVLGQGKRRDGVIALQDDLHIPRYIWFFSRGLPVKWSGPGLNAQRSEVAVESIEIAHEGLTLL